MAWISLCGLNIVRWLDIVRWAGCYEVTGYHKGRWLLLDGLDILGLIL